MGFMDWLTRSVPDPTPRDFALTTPWSEHQFSPSIVIADVFGGSVNAPLTREMAMQVPAVSKARHLICTTIAAATWQTWRGETDQPLATQPLWLTRTSSSTPPYLRWIWTLDDALFYGWSLWAVQRGADKAILDAVRIPRARWEFDAVGRVMVDGEMAKADEVVLFAGPFEGLLVTGANTIRGALDMERAWQARVRNPAAVVEIHNTDANDPLTKTEAEKMVTDYNSKRRSLDGVTTYTPANVELKMHGEASDLLVNGRNAVAIDIARLTGLPAIELDASQVQASLQYSTTETGRRDLIDAISNMWADPIAARLSLDDVTPRGTRIEANFNSALTYPGAVQVAAPGAPSVQQVEQQQPTQGDPNASA